MSTFDKENSLSLFSLSLLSLLSLSLSLVSLSSLSLPSLLFLLPYHRRPQLLGQLRRDLPQPGRVVPDDRLRVAAQVERVGEHAVVVVAVRLRGGGVVGRAGQRLAPLAVEVHRQLPARDLLPEVARGGGVRLEHVLGAPPRRLDRLDARRVEARAVAERAKGPRLVERRPVLDLLAVLLEDDGGVAGVVVDDLGADPASVLVLEGLGEVLCFDGLVSRVFFYEFFL